MAGRLQQHETTPTVIVSSASHRSHHETDDDDDDPSIIPEIELFIPLTDSTTPQSHFLPGISSDPFTVRVPRFYHISKPNTILIYTDGACLNNGQPTARAGCAFHFRPASQAMYICTKRSRAVPFGE
ncbi:hypothetical protein TWF694_005727 [Orbilia ellipsospora]|uniref:Uncharacterized protein n=1 Tax=Orbilia ellipsospora TaxID=2528407 RepID=A0AAV9WUA8_9PEZI